MAGIASDAPDGATVLRPPSAHALAHIPGDDGWPVLGSTLQALGDTKAFFESRAARHGLMLRVNTFGETGVHMLGPEANEFLFLDPQRLFSSRLGWGRFLDRVFPGGLLTMDFDHHRAQRRALSVAFKAGAMKAYLAILDEGIAARVAQWRAAPGPMAMYPALKQLTLDLAAASFLGGAIGPETEPVTAAFVDMLAATVAVIRAPLPGTQMRRGVQGRARIVEYFSRQVPLRREQGGDDLFSQLCRATTDDGALLSVEAVVDHMSLVMMAAHDTLTSSLTAFVWMLAAHTDWQARLRDEVAGLGLGAGAPLPFERLDAMAQTDMAFKEVLRLIPPVPAVPRRALRDFDFRGYRIPAGTSVVANPLFTHHMPSVWPEPERFDPTRFTDTAQGARHRFAFVPFGGGAHMCLGLHFALMQAKCFARHLLPNLAISMEPGYAPKWRMWPIPKPKDGLRVSVARL